MTGCNGTEKEAGSTICSRRKIKLNAEEWSCENMKKYLYYGNDGLSYMLHRNYYLSGLVLIKKLYTMSIEFCGKLFSGYFGGEYKNGVWNGSVIK